MGPLSGVKYPERYNSTFNVHKRGTHRLFLPSPTRCHPDVTPAAPRVDATTPRLDAVFSVGLDRKWQEFYHVTLEQLPRAAPFIPWLRRRADVYVHVAEKRSRRGHDRVRRRVKVNEGSLVGVTEDCVER